MEKASDPIGKIRHQSFFGGNGRCSEGESGVLYMSICVQNSKGRRVVGLRVILADALMRRVNMRRGSCRLHRRIEGGDDRRRNRHGGRLQKGLPGNLENGMLIVSPN